MNSHSQVNVACRMDLCLPWMCGCLTVPGVVLVASQEEVVVASQEVVVAFQVVVARHVAIHFEIRIVWGTRFRIA